MDYDLNCGHAKAYRFKDSEDKNTACLVCVRDRLWKSIDEKLASRRAYEELRPSIDIDCPVGTKIVLWYPHWGYPGDQKDLQRHNLKLGRVYTVRQMDAFSSHTDIYLEEVPGRIPFNHVHFAYATEGDILDHENRLNSKALNEINRIP